MKKRILKKKYPKTRFYPVLSDDISYPKVTFFAAERDKSGESIILKVEEGDLTDVIVELFNFKFHETDPLLLFDKNVLYVPKKSKYDEDLLDDIIKKTILDILNYAIRNDNFVELAK